MGTRRYVGFLRRCVGYHQKEFLSTLASQTLRQWTFRTTRRASPSQGRTRRMPTSPSNVSVDLKKDFRKVAKRIMKKTEGCNYRKDLKKPALARWYKIWKSQQAAAQADKD